MKHRDPDATLDALAAMRAGEAFDAREVMAYALPEFRAGRAVLFCYGAGHPIVACYSRDELTRAMAGHRTLN